MTDAYGNDAATSTGTIADTTNNAASGAPQRAESTERLARPLIKLAKACGLATSFIDQLGTYTEISDAALVAVLKALDVDASNDEAIVRSMTQLEVENSKRLLPSTIVATTGKPTGITLNCSSDADITASIELEDGTAFGHFALLPNLNSGKPDLTIAPDLPMGYHTLRCTGSARGGAIHRRPRAHSRAGGGRRAPAVGLDDADVFRAVPRIVGHRRLRRSEASFGRCRREVQGRLHAHQSDSRRRADSAA